MTSSMLGTTRSRLRRVLAAAAVAALAGPLLIAEAADAAVIPSPNPSVAWVSPSDGAVTEVDAKGQAGPAGNGLGAAPGTSPASTIVPGGGRQVALHGADHHLWYVGRTNVVHDTGALMAAGSSPAIAPLANPFTGAGGAVIAFAGSDNALHEIGVSTDEVLTPGGGLGVALGTSPAVACDFLGFCVIAFNAWGTNHLWYVDRLNVAHDTGIAMLPGSSPSITELSGTTDFVIAFTRGDNLLAVFSTKSGSSIAANGLGVAPNTAPAIRAAGPTTYEIAFHAAVTDTLWTVTPDNVGHATDMFIEPGTSPTLANLSPGFQILFHGSGHSMWRMIGDRFTNLHLNLAAGTSPASHNMFEGTTPGTEFKQVASNPGIAAPTLTNLAKSAGKVTLTWTDNSTNEDKFQVLRRDPAAGPPVTAKDQATLNRTAQGQTYVFTDTIPADSTRCYMIASLNDTGAINYSNEKCTTPVTLPAAPAPVLGSVSNIGFDGAYTGMTIGADGRGIVAFYGSNALRVSHCNDVACTSATSRTIDSNGDVGRFPAIRIGGDGLPLIAYHYLKGPSMGPMRIAHCSDVACTGPVTIVPLASSESGITDEISLSIGQDGLGFIAFLDLSASSDDNPDAFVKIVHCLDASCSSRTTRIVDTLDNPKSLNGDSRPRVPTAVNPATGAISIAYFDGALNDLKVATCPNPDCLAPQTVTVDPNGPTGQSAAITFGRDGLPLLAYTQSTGPATPPHLMVAHCANIYCAGDVTPVTVDASGGLPSLAVGADGLGVIAYSEPANDDLRVAHCTTIDCSSFTTRSVDEFGILARLGSAIAIGTDGLPLIAYAEDGPPGAPFKVLHCGDVSCATDVVAPF